jgi:hypothetical protein
MRDDEVLREERLGSRSRAAFAYGGALGVGAGEVVDAFAAHVAAVLGSVPEDRPLRPAPLPAVVAEVLTPGSDTAPAPGDAAPAPEVAPMPAADAIPAPVETSPAAPTTPVAAR